MDFFANKIRNVAVLGHQGSGKTSLVEALNSIASGQDKGSIEKKNTISDFLQEERNRLTSCSLSVVPIEYQDHKINLIDIPGNDDFIYEAIGVTRLIKGAILVIDASSGVQVETIKHYKLLKKKGIPTIIYCNKMDKEDIDFDNLLLNIQEHFGKTCIPFCLPLGHEKTFDGFVNVVDLKARKYNGKECVDDEIYDDKKPKVIELHNMIMEQVAVTSDSLLEKFFAGETLTNEEIHTGLRKGVLEGQLTPILVGSSLNNIGLHTLLSMLISYLPNPNDLKPYEGLDKDGKVAIRKTESEEPFSGYIFKTTVDSYNGTISILKVNSGVLKMGDEIYCPNIDKSFKISSLMFIKGKEQTKVNEVQAGDICAISKIDELNTSFTICDKNNPITYKQVSYPTPVYYRAIKIKDKKDEDKLNGVLQKILKESPCIELKRNNETKQLLLGGLSDTHLNYINERIKNNYQMEISFDAPKVVYRETIKVPAQAIGKYVKQSGGSGFYGVVDMKFEPSEDNVFTEQIFGGSVPKNYFPAIEKGFFEALQSGPLAGFPVVGVKAILLDGKYHPVDSNEQAFKMASILAFKEAYMKCKPTILEPIMKITIHISNNYIGNIQSDLSLRRASILDMNELEGDTEIVALAPESEILDYATKLRALTQGSGYFNREFDSFKEVPAHLIEKVLKENSLLNKGE